jgi:hypothetical protein
MGVGTETEWQEFLRAIGELLPSSAAEYKPEMRLVEDLRLDSLALTELLVVVLETYNPPTLSRRLEDRPWDGVTLGMIFEECQGRTSLTSHTPLGPLDSGSKREDDWNEG